MLPSSKTRNIVFLGEKMGSKLHNMIGIYVVARQLTTKEDLALFCVVNFRCLLQAGLAVKMKETIIFLNMNLNELWHF